MKKVIHLFFVLFISASAFSQTANSKIADTTIIPYGNNPAVGKYYNVRGIKIYAEEYGAGKPLLMIHGNGGSGKAFKRNIPYFENKYRVIIADSRAPVSYTHLRAHETDS